MKLVAVAPSIWIAVAAVALATSPGSSARADATAKSGTGGYPWASAACAFGAAGGADCANPRDKSDRYDWYFDEDNNGRLDGGCGARLVRSGECFDRWGYEYRNCTSYVAWKLSSLGVPPSLVVQLGNAAQWSGNARKRGVHSGRAAEQGAVAVDASAARPFGHIAFVDSVHANGTITVSEYNRPSASNGFTYGTFGTRTGTPAALGLTTFIYFSRFERTSPTTSSSAAFRPATNTG